MNNQRSDDLTFVFIGTENYHFMILKNIELLRLIYPYSPILVYDWGDGYGEPSSTNFPSDSEVIQWHDRIMDTWPLMKIYTETRRIEIGKTFNSRREHGIGKRLTKFMLKRFPNSNHAQKAIYEGLRYENFLIHKAYNLMDCSRVLEGKAFFLMDADAFLVEPIDEIFEDSPDVIIPMDPPELHRWDYNNVQGLNSGVLGFGKNTKAREAFLSEWYEGIKGNDEWLREIAAMDRMIKELDPDFFNDWGVSTLNFQGQPTRIRKVQNHIYSAYFNYQDRPQDMASTKILHLAGIAQRPHLFPKYISEVEDEIALRLK